MLNPALDITYPEARNENNIVFAPQENAEPGELEGCSNPRSKIVHFHHPHSRVTSTPETRHSWELQKPQRTRPAGVTNPVTVDLFWPFSEGQGHASSSVGLGAHSSSHPQPEAELPMVCVL